MRKFMGTQSHPYLSGILVFIGLLLSNLAVAECGGLWQASWQNYRAQVQVAEQQACSLGSFELTIARPDGKQHRLVSQRDGRITELWVTDLNKDGRAEVIVAFTRVGSGSYGHLLIYSSRIGHLARWPEPPLPEALKRNYQGGDRYRLTADGLLRTYQDSEGQPLELLFSPQTLTWLPR